MGILGVGARGLIGDGFVGAPIAVGRKLVMMGDSITAQGNTNRSVTVSSSGQVVTVTGGALAHYVGERVFFTSSADSNAFCGELIVESVLSTTQWSYQAAMPVPAGSFSRFEVNDSRRTNLNYMMLANSLAGWPVDLVNRGMSGSTTARQLARLGIDVLSMSPDVVYWGLSTNDARADYTGDQMFANVREGVERILNSGAQVILHTGTPFDSGATDYTAARLYAYTKARGLLREYALTRRGVHLFDLFALLSDPTSATGNYVAEYANADKIHLSAAGAGAIAYTETLADRSLKTLLEKLFPIAGPRLGCVFSADTYETSSGATGNFAPNALMVLGSGGVVTSPLEGTMPERWAVLQATGDVAATASIDTAPTGYGNAMVLTLGGSGAGTLQAITASAWSVHAAVTPGGLYKCSGYISAADMANTTVELGAAGVIGGQNLLLVIAGRVSVDFDGVLHSPVFRMPAGLTSCRLYVNVVVAGGTSEAVVKLSNVELRKVA